jgi:magnesium transporter
MARTFLQRHPTDAARLLEGQPTAEIVEVLSGLAPAEAGRLLEGLTPALAADVVAGLDQGAAQRLLPQIDLRTVAALMARLDPETREARLAWLDRATEQEIRALMSYPSESAGSLMDARVNAFHGDMSVEDALRRLRKRGQRRILDIFLVDGERRLVGAVALEDLVLARPKAPLSVLERRPAAQVMAVASREEVVETFEQQRLTSLPVVDVEGRLLGVVRYDTLVAAAEEEATASIQTMVGVSREERALSKVSFAVRKRLPWLEINLATAFLAAAVVGLFEETIAGYTALAILLPVVAGQSGNTGAQALAVTMRGLALREIRVRQWLRVVLKETRVGLLTGVAVALTTGVAVLAWSGSTGLTLVIVTSMIISMVAAALAGAVIPIVLTAVGQDPAQSSSIVLTTVTDVVGFFSFLGIATLCAGML